MYGAGNGEHEDAVELLRVLENDLLLVVDQTLQLGLDVAVVEAHDQTQRRTLDTAAVVATEKAFLVSCRAKHKKQQRSICKIQSAFKVHILVSCQT